MITEKQVTTIIKRQVRNIKKKGPENVPMTLVQFIKKKNKHVRVSALVEPVLILWKLKIYIILFLP